MPGIVIIDLIVEIRLPALGFHDLRVRIIIMRILYGTEYH